MTRWLWTGGGTDSVQDQPRSDEPDHNTAASQLTFSLPVLLLSVSDSAPEEEGLWPPATRRIHGGRIPCCHWLLRLSMLCWGISGRLKHGEALDQGRCTTTRPQGSDEHCGNDIICSVATPRGSARKIRRQFTAEQWCVWLKNHSNTCGLAEDRLRVKRNT